MDLADTLMFLAGVLALYWTSNPSKGWKRLWPDSTGLTILWLVWFIILALGLFTNKGVNSETFSALIEFRWMIIFQVLCFSVAKINWNQKLVNMLNAILLIMVLVSFILFYRDYARDFRAGGPFQHSMPFAHIYGPAFLLITGILLVTWKENQNKWLGITTSVLSAVIVTMSLTRGIWLGMTIAAIVISFFRSWKYCVGLALLIAVSFALVFTLSPNARERVATTNNNQSDETRKILWKANFEIVKDFPLLGTGYSQNKNYLPEYYKKMGYPEDQFVSHAHNQYLHFWAGTGTLGLLCYLIFIASVFTMTTLAYLKLPITAIWERGLALGSIGAQICFHVGAITESNFSIAKNRYMYLLIASLGVSLYYRYISDHKKAGQVSKP